MNEIENFKEMFWDAFHKPALSTEKFLKLWESIEPVNDLLAGPFYNIYSKGNCDYIFSDKQRFSFINSIDDFYDYTESLIRKYHEAIDEVSADTEDEKKDKQILLYQTDLKMELAHLAYEIQKERINPPDKE